MGIPFLVFLAAVGAIGVFAIVPDKRLVSLTQRSRASWPDADAQLTRRTDLVPNLVESVTGYATPEGDTLDVLVKARGATLSARSEEARRYFELDRPEERQVPPVSLGS